jgi:nucleotide-binding universal stress UspA family protein
MLHSILVALDGEEGSDAVVELAVRWAKEFGARLTGIGVVDDPVGREPIEIHEPDLELASMQGHWKREREQVESQLKRFEQQCELAGVTATVCEQLGVPYEGILIEARRHDLIVLNQHFKTPESAENTLHEVLKHAPRPVVVVPTSAPQGRSIVIGYDGSLQASRALYALQASGLGQTKKVHIVAVDADAMRATRLADEAGEYLALHDIEADSRPVPSSVPPADLLLQAASDLGAELLVLGAYGTPRLKEFLLGSITKSLLKQSPFPLFLFH